MELRGAALNQLYTNVTLLFQQGYEGPEVWADKLAMTVPSTTAFNLYGWMAALPYLRKWLGPRVIQNINTHAQLVKNEDWELTEAIPRNALEDDTYGLYAYLPIGMGWSTAKWADSMLLDALRANAPSYDGVPFFNGSHPVVPGAISPSASGVWGNLFALTLNPTNFATVQASAASIPGENGKPLGVRYKLLIVPPQLEVMGRQILNAQLIAAAAGTGTTVAMTNVLQGAADLLVIDELADEPTTWYMADMSRPVKPFVVQRRKNPVFVYRNAPTDDNVFWNREMIIGVDARGAAAPALPFLMAKSVGP